MYRQNAQWIKPEFLSAALHGQPSPPRKNKAIPMNVYRGGGMFFTEHHEDSRPMSAGYRHVLITENTSSLRFYHLNTEHAQSDANVEVDKGANVHAYGLQSEGSGLRYLTVSSMRVQRGLCTTGRFCVLWIRNSVNVTVSGYGGNACAWPMNSSYPAGMIVCIHRVFS